jgi:hypothetical protein
MRNPPGDVRAEVFVLEPITLPQDRLFVEEDRQMESNPNCNTVLKNADTLEKQPLTEN